MPSKEQMTYANTDHHKWTFAEAHPWVVYDSRGRHDSRFTNCAAAEAHAREIKAPADNVVYEGVLEHEDVIG